MLCNERIMGDLLDRFQMGRASYELKADESEVIRAKFNTTSSPLYNSPDPTPVQLLTHAKNAKEFCAWKVPAVQSSAQPAQAEKLAQRCLSRSLTSSVHSGAASFHSGALR
jgi:hypothetical protein